MKGHILSSKHIIEFSMDVLPSLKDSLFVKGFLCIYKHVRHFFLDFIFTDIKCYHQVIDTPLMLCYVILYHLMFIT